MSDKERDSIQEMEDIQKGLEAFLQQEMQEMQASGAGARRSTGRPAANAQSHGQFQTGKERSNPGTCRTSIKRHYFTG